MIAALAAAVLAAVPLQRVGAQESGRSRGPRETHLQVGAASLYVRAVGQGPAVIVLHGGPDFDHGYLLPDLDRLADRFHLIYYDQRGRGESAANVRPEEVTLASDMDDLDRVRRHFHLQAPIILGHSWGAVLAMEYAVRHPTHVSRLILMNPAPASAADYAIMRQAYLAALGADMDRQRAMIAGAAYQHGDPEAVAARYRIHFIHAFGNAADYETMMARMRAGFIRQGREGILEARTVEAQLMRDTWQADGYDLTPRLRDLRVPTLVITGDHDFIPAEVAAHIAHSLPTGELVTLAGCGHFAFLECAPQVHAALDSFMRQR